MSSLTEKAEKAGHTVAETAKAVGNKVAEGAEKAVEYVKDITGIGDRDADITRIKDRMDVIASCRRKVGVVDHVKNLCIKLTRKDSPDGKHHFIPVAWVQSVDSRVHLKKNALETEQGWKSDLASCV